MKKLLTALITSLLALAMIFTIAGCSGTLDSLGGTSDNGGTSNNESIGNSGGTGSNEDTINFAEKDIINNNECMVKISGIELDTVFGLTLKAQLENKSTTKTYVFLAQSGAINGVECPPLLAQTVTPGRKSNYNIIFTTTELEENGITKFTDIELAVRVLDNDNLLSDPVGVGSNHIYPYGEENAVKFVRVPKPTDNIIIDNQYVSVIVTGYEVDSIFGYSTNLFVVNKTDTTIMLGVLNASINGYMISPAYAISVSPNNCAFNFIAWSEDMLEVNGIIIVEEIEFNLFVLDVNNIFTDYFADELITLNP